MDRRTFLRSAIAAAAVGTVGAGQTAAASAEAFEIKMGTPVLFPVGEDRFEKGIVAGFSLASDEHAASVPGHQPKDSTVVVYADQKRKDLRFFSEQLKPAPTV